LGSGIAKENVLNFGYVIFLTLFYCKKKLLPVVKIQNRDFILDGVEIVYIFQPIFSKMIITQFFYSFIYFGLKFEWIFFLLKIQNGGII
jgi:hypothetical protein